MTATAITQPDKPAFQYSWCMTDKKDGAHIREGYREIDYIYDEPYATQVKDMLEKLGLPQPTYKDVFRGTHHDLLFIASHGVVLRIGPTDVKKLISPGILQPLGWIESKDLIVRNLPFTVTIYPGIDHVRNAIHETKISGLHTFFKNAGQSVCDTSDRNLGVIRIMDDNNEPAVVNVVLDIDNVFTSSDLQRSAMLETTLKKFEQSLNNPADVLAHTLLEAFQDVADVRYYQRAFDAHQPLREMFWAAFKDVDAPDITARNNFWKACAALTNKPQKTVVPLWSMNKDENGKTTFVRKEVSLPPIALHTPWTHNPTNRVIKHVHPDNKQEKIQAI